jgi:hypothetical protein
MAFALNKLISQVNEIYPHRSKISDGGIGDKRHQSKRSDHNPWIKDASGIGIVTAYDFTHDLANGIDCQELADQLVANKDSRIKYIIWNDKILFGADPIRNRIKPDWRWGKYKGKNPHVKHLHLSVKAQPEFYDDDSQWDLDLTQRGHVMLPANFSKIKVQLIQSRLLYLGFLDNWTQVDGILGPITRGAIKEFQRIEGLIMDGIVGRKTLKKLQLNLAFDI